MWLKMYEENGSQVESYRVDPKVIKISDRVAAKSFAPALLERYKQLEEAKPRKPDEDAPILYCTLDILEYHEETLDRHLQLLMDTAMSS